MPPLLAATGPLTAAGPFTAAALPTDAAPADAAALAMARAPAANSASRSRLTSQGGRVRRGTAGGCCSPRGAPAPGCRDSGGVRGAVAAGEKMRGIDVVWVPLDPDAAPDSNLCTGDVCDDSVCSLQVGSNSCRGSKSCHVVREEGLLLDCAMAGSGLPAARICMTRAYTLLYVVLRV